MEFLSYLITGISLGSIYAIIALGYTMVYGIAKMLNFAHGDVIMVGAYVSFYVTMFAGSNLLGEDPSALTTGAVALVSVLLAMVVCTVLGVVIEGLAYRPLRQAGSLAVLITAIGVSYFLQNAAQLLFGANPKNFTPVVSGQLTLFDGQLRISYVALLTITACVVIMLGLTAFTGKSKMGKAMRACSEDRGAAQLMGINVNATISMTFAIGSALAAIAGVLLCSYSPVLQPTTGSMPGIKAFTAAVFGGIGSIPGAFLGGLLLGVIEAMAQAYISTQLSNTILFAVLIVVLLVKPSGLLGKYVPEKVWGGGMKGYFKNMKTITKVDFATYLGVILAFIVVSVCQAQGLVNRSLGGMLVPICCYVCMSISLNLTVGILGELSLGHAGFMSVGAFSGIIAAMSLQSAVPNDLVRMIVALVVGAFFAAIVGFIVGIPVLRLRGDYLAIVTLAFGEIIKDLINCLLVGWDENGLHIALNVDGTKSMSSLGLSENGIEIIKGAQGATGNARIATFAMGFALVMITLVVVLNLVRSRTGRAIMAIRDNRIAAESVGINVTKYKLIAFVTSASLAGAAGALFGLNYSNVTAVQFDFNTSILVLVYVVLGGLGNIWGSIVATVVLYVLPEALRQFSDYRMLVYAIVLILVMLATNNPQVRTLISRIIPRRKGAALDE